MPGANQYNGWDGLPGQKKIAFDLVPNGSTSVTISANNGRFSSTRTGVGLVTITLDDNYPSLEFFAAEVSNLLANDVRLGVFTARPAGGGPSTITIGIFADGTTGAAAADIAAGANNFIKIFMVVQTTNKKV